MHPQDEPSAASMRCSRESDSLGVYGATDTELVAVAEHAAKPRAHDSLFGFIAHEGNDWDDEENESYYSEDSIFAAEERSLFSNDSDALIENDDAKCLNVDKGKKRRDSTDFSGYLDQNFGENARRRHDSQATKLSQIDFVSYDQTGDQFISGHTGVQDDWFVAHQFISSGAVDSAMAGVSHVLNNTQQAAQQVLNNPLNAAQNAWKRRPGTSTNSLGSPAGIGINEKEQVRKLFATGSAEVLKPEHRNLGKVVRHIFCQEEPAGYGYRSNSLLAEYGSKMDARQCPRLFREVCGTIVKHNCFTLFFMALTIYMLFVPDIILAYGSREIDDDVAAVNTVVFFFFVIELLFFALGQKSYWFSVNIILDSVALLSLLPDTLLLDDLAALDSQAAQVMKMARSSRITRMARMARVAKITRLIPSLLRMCTKQKMQLARIVLLRRLWRIFCFLDTDMDEKISPFDLKVLYLNIMQECPEIVGKEKLKLLQDDVAQICKLQVIKDNSQLSFADYCRIISGTGLGKRMYRHHQRDVAQDHGVLQFTQRLSDNTALKVCIGIIFLIGAMNLLQIEVQDIGVEQGLAQLDSIAQAERLEPTWNGDVLCQQIGIYTEKYDVMFLYLRGYTYWQDGICIPEGIPASQLEPYDTIDSMIEEYNRRDSEILKACWPAQDCNRGGLSTSSLVLVDKQEQAQAIAFSALMVTLVVILLLLTFVYILNLGISKFSKTMLQPLRAISDDMKALSHMDLVQIDSEMPGEHEMNIEVAEELVQLQSAFVQMKVAIRLWAKYVPPSVVQRLFQAGMEASLGVGRCDVSVLFCDIAGFEDICAGLPPQKVLEMLSTVLDKIADIIHKNKGTLIEFIGDEVLAVFNTPNPSKMHIYETVKSAVEIHAVVNQLEPIRRQDGTEAYIRCRCGVNTANLLCGNLGSYQRIKYGCLGDGVNLTARVKGLTTRYQTETLATEAVLQGSDGLVRKKFIHRPVDLVAVKGKKEPTRVHQILRAVNLQPGEIPKDTAWMKVAALKHADAWRLYLAKDFEGAKAAFTEVFNAFQANAEIVDEPSRLLRQRCIGHIKNPPPDDWDGVDRLTKKSFSVAPEEELKKEAYQDTNSQVADEKTEDERISEAYEHHLKALIQNEAIDMQTLKAKGLNICEDQVCHNAEANLPAEENYQIVETHANSLFPAFCCMTNQFSCGHEAAVTVTPPIVAVADSPVGPDG